MAEPSSNQPDLLTRLRLLFDSEDVAVLATHRDGQPHGTLVGFEVGPNLKSILFATPRTTRKYENIAADPRVAITVDDRRRAEADFYEALAVTATGIAEEIPKTGSSRHLRRFMKKHPHLHDFVMSPNCALMIIRVKKYTVVQRFQEVIELEV